MLRVGSRWWLGSKTRRLIAWLWWIDLSILYLPFVFSKLMKAKLTKISALKQRKWKLPAKFWVLPTNQKKENRQQTLWSSLMTIWSSNRLGVSPMNHLGSSLHRERLNLRQSQIKLRAILKIWKSSKPQLEELKRWTSQLPNHFAIFTTIFVTTWKSRMSS